MVITITVPDDVWLMINKRRKPGQAMADVIRLALQELPELNKKEKKQ
jgi:hypothetical protein